MARLKINIPGIFLAFFAIAVRTTDINYGTTGEKTLVEIIHEVRVQFLSRCGFTEFDASGVSLTISELSI